MPLGMVVGLALGDVLLDGTQLRPEKRAHPHPIFGQCIVAKGLHG